MSGSLEHLQESSSWEEMRASMGNYLGLGAPIPSGALKRMLKDELFAHYVMVSKEEPFLLQQFLNDPRNAAYEAMPMEQESSDRQGHEKPTNRELIGRAAKALVKWGKSGFSIVDEQSLKRREDACLSCPHLSQPEKKLQRILPMPVATEKTGKRTGQRVCRLCGCNVAMKIKLPSEACPDRHPEQEGYSRWGEKQGVGVGPADAFEHNLQD